MKKIGVFVAVIASMFLLAGAVMAADITDPLLKKLIEKGILTRQDAISIMKEVEKEKSGEQKKHFKAYFAYVFKFIRIMFRDIKFHKSYENWE